jgi:glycosyltransferase involved in cell wall biosynthesis
VWRLGVEIPAAIPPRRAQDEAIVLMVGRFVEKKGFEYGIRAFADLVATGARARLRLVGDGQRRDRYVRIARERGIEGKVEFLGRLPHHEVLAQMERADVLLAPSVVAERGNRESGLIVVKEANARGVPAIGTRHGGIPEIIDHGQTGFLVPERDTEQLAHHLGALVRDPGLREEMGRRAREKMVREYDIVERVRALETHYDEVTGQR